MSERWSPNVSRRKHRVSPVCPSISQRSERPTLTLIQNWTRLVTAMFRPVSV
ncbi:hypothetical protein FIBSPDRAFT_876982 [Athelia psychrophila]|uniref:Uncharacterized protein n=1 Tax=Athelia psychrophila TaxID=1759441 RepID=A0A167WCB9_9AGAM|nr:hypothetical protein FIBSPDRAFT_876982 [Fibularhizoctonia sp. CBS 109695]